MGQSSPVDKMSGIVITSISLRVSMDTELSVHWDNKRDVLANLKEIWVSQGPLLISRGKARGHLRHHADPHAG